MTTTVTATTTTATITVPPTTTLTTTSATTKMPVFETGTVSIVTDNTVVNNIHSQVNITYFHLNVTFLITLFIK